MIGEKKLSRYMTLSFSSVVALFLAIAPVLDPYIVAEISAGFTLRVNDVFAVTLGIIGFLKNYKIDRHSGFLIYWCLFMAVISLFGILGSLGKNGISFFAAYKNIIIWTVYSFLIMYLWKVPCREKFLNCVTVIGIVCSMVIILQFICGHLNINFWDGRISIFQLSKYDGWAGYIDRNTFDIRPCGIFQEPSYCGIYLLVALTYCLKKNKYFMVGLFGISLILTTSLVGILGAVIVMLYYMLFSNDRVSKKYKWIMLLGIIILFAFFTISQNSAIQSLLQYVTRRLSNITSDLQAERMGSTKWRLLGNIYLFSGYNLWQKLFGMGANQYASHFRVVNYSNNIINIILNYGIIGFLGFIFLLKRLFDRVEKENHIYFIIMLLIFLVDQQWFNWFFFYLLSACVLKSETDSNIKQR